MSLDTWVFMAILMATGVKMVIDPEGFGSLPHELASAILDQSFESKVALSPAGRLGMRIGGVGLIALAFAIVVVSEL